MSGYLCTLGCFRVNSWHMDHDIDMTDLHIFILHKEARLPFIYEGEYQTKRVYI